MRILVVSDEESKYIWDHYDPERFKDVELIISCGDLKQEYLSFLVTMLPVPLFYVPGNHDTTYKSKPPEGCVSIDGKLIEYKGIRIMGLGGSNKYSSGDYQYTESQMRRRLRKFRFKLWRNKGIDILVTHAPAYQLGDGEDLCHRGFNCFVDFMEQYAPKYLLHGHQHLNYGRGQRIHQYKNTRIINGFGYYLLDF
ncbi:metallophosphoesterase [Paenibacillus oenotherae]|uniref:Metallophosphoesterase n=2 Tax=Paenibacillus oenotherae TaxID=1435645 RepID=A0ABS7D925_9BACL|nr:metallophosphoesterase [Paenibacillus oenotherae]